jgi:hypothetical protein
VKAFEECVTRFGEEAVGGRVDHLYELLVVYWSARDEAAPPGEKKNRQCALFLAGPFRFVLPVTLRAKNAPPKRPARHRRGPPHA